MTKAVKNIPHEQLTIQEKVVAALDVFQRKGEVFFKGEKFPIFEPVDVMPDIEMLSNRIRRLRSGEYISPQVKQFEFLFGRTPTKLSNLQVGQMYKTTSDYTYVVMQVFQKDGETNMVSQRFPFSTAKNAENYKFSRAYTKGKSSLDITIMKAFIQLRYHDNSLKLLSNLKEYKNFI